jgi:hypothetical protein
MLQVKKFWLHQDKKTKDLDMDLWYKIRKVFSVQKMQKYVWHGFERVVINN